MDVRRIGWVVVFAGVAMAALGLVSLGEWAPVARALHGLDITIDSEHADTLAELLPLSWDDDEWLERAGLLTLAVAVGGLLLSWKFPRAGAAAVGAGLVASVVLAVMYVEWSMVVGSVTGTHCGPDVFVRTAHDFIDVRRFALLVSLVAAAALVRWGRSREALISGSVSLVMVSAPLWLEAFEARVVVVAGAFFSFSLTRWFEVAVPRFALALSVVVLVAGTWSVVVVSHDARVAEAFESELRGTLWWAPNRVVTLSADRCEEAPLTTTIHTYETINIFGANFDSPVEVEKVHEKFADLAAQREELGGYGPLQIDIEADRHLSLADFFALIRAFKRVERSADFVTLVFMRASGSPLWSRPSIHAHTCGLKVMISDDGLRESDFANFEEVFNAAARGGLKLNVRQALEDEGH